MDFKSFRRLLPPVLLLPLLLLPGAARAGVREGLALCGELLIPSLFPISVLSGCLVRMGEQPGLGPGIRRVLGLSEAAALPLLLGLLGGFPLGAQLLSEQYARGRLSRQEAIHLSPLCNQAGPGFLLGAAASVLGSPRLGLALLLIQLLSLLLTGLFLGFPGMAASPPAPPSGEGPSFFAVLPQSIGASAKGMLGLTGSVCFFAGLRACLETPLPLGLFSPGVRGAVSGFLELSGGVALLKDCPTEQALPLAAALCAWGGLCVHLQAAEAFSRAGLPMGCYLRGKLLQGLNAGLLGLLTASLRQGLPWTRLCLRAAPLLLLLFFSFYKKRHWKSTASVL